MLYMYIWDDKKKYIYWTRDTRATCPCKTSIDCMASPIWATFQQHHRCLHKTTQGWRMERRVPSKRLSPFALLSSSTVLGWPQRLSDNAPAPGQRCMDVLPNTWGHPGSAQLPGETWARDCKAALSVKKTRRHMCTEAPRNTRFRCQRNVPFCQGANSAQMREIQHYWHF